MLYGLHIGTAPENFYPGDNYYGVYLGGKNPVDDETLLSSYCMPPIDPTDYAAYCHDKGYDAVEASGISSALFANKTAAIDLQLVMDCNAAWPSVKGIRYFSEWKAKAMHWNRGAAILFQELGTRKSNRNVAIKLLKASVKTAAAYQCPIGLMRPVFPFNHGR